MQFGSAPNTALITAFAWPVEDQAAICRCRADARVQLPLTEHRFELAANYMFGIITDKILFAGNATFCRDKCSQGTYTG